MASPTTDGAISALATIVRCLSLVLAFVLFLPQAGASAACLKLERARSGSTGYWINACSHGVTVRWTTGTGRTGIRWVRAGDVIWIRLGPPDVGVTWRECRSDTPYESRPVERGGRWNCRSR